MAPHLLAALADKPRWLPAADGLVALGPAAGPLVQAALRQATDPALVHRLATVLERLGAPDGRAALLALAQRPDLFARAVALRALRRFAPAADEAPVIDGLLREELAQAARLLHGLVADDRPALRLALDYELGLLHQRIFGLLARLYDPELVATAQRNVAHAARERQANALEILDNLIPHDVYRGLQALLDDSPLADKAYVLAALAGTAGTAAPTRRPLLAATAADRAAADGAGPAPAAAALAGTPAEPLPALLLRQGRAAFTSWTLSVALRHWQPAGADGPAVLQPYLAADSALLRESALLAAQALAAYRGETVAALFPELAMSHSPAPSEARVSALERVMVLKSTALFAHTPENVLSSIVPIMKEVTFGEGQEIFAKGDLGNSLFIVHDGQVGVFNGGQALATFGPGDFFGELALLDAEPRSATAAALSEVLVFRLDQEDFYDVMEERGEVLRNILRLLCQRIRRQNEKMRELAGKVSG